MTNDENIPSSIQSTLKSRTTKRLTANNVVFTIRGGLVFFISNLSQFRYESISYRPLFC